MDHYLISFGKPKKFRFLYLYIRESLAFFRHLPALPKKAQPFAPFFQVRIFAMRSSKLIVFLLRQWGRVAPRIHIKYVLSSKAMLVEGNIPAHIIQV